LIAMKDLVESQLKVWPTMVKLIDTLRDTAPSIREARSLLRTRFLSSLDPVKPTLPQEDVLCQFLAAEGAIVADPTRSSYQISSPLIRTLLLYHVLAFDKRPAPSAAVPFKIDGGLDLLGLARLSIPFLDRD